MNTPSKKLRWKQNLKLRQKTEYNNWLNGLQTKLHSDVQTRSNHNLERHVKQLGTGTSYFMSLKPNKGSVRSITHVQSPLPAKFKIPLRCIKAGHISHTLVLKRMLDQNWHKKGFDQQLSAVMCPCNGAVQDIQHTVTTCELTGHLYHTWVESVREILLLTNGERGSWIKTDHMALEEMQGQDCIANMLHMRYKDQTPCKLKEMLKAYGTLTATFITELEGLQKAQFSNNEE
jgi:hypothetical protein